jgi:hypothetical protein
MVTGRALLLQLGILCYRGNSPPKTVSTVAQPTTGFTLMKITVALVAVLGAVTAVTSVAAQEVLTTNLATHAANTTITYSVDAGTYRVQVRNLVPAHRSRYDISVKRATRPIPPLSNADLKPHAFAEPRASEREPAPCARLIDAYTALWEATDEKHVPGLVADLEAALNDNPSGAGCKPESVKAAEALKAATVTSVERDFNLLRGQDLTVVVTKRSKGASDPAQIWTSVYSPSPRGEWRASYGFSFVSDWPYGDDRYFAKEVAANRYAIEEEERRAWMHFVPAVFFSWLPAEAELSSWHSSWTGGLGFDLSAPVVFFGRSRTYNQNLSVSYGIALRQQSILRGRYTEGDTIQANLTEDQLHSQQYRPNVFVSVALRFGSNPFSQPE